MGHYISEEGSSVKTIIELLLVAIFVICGWTGYKKGIIMGIGGILIIIISLFGAHLLSETFSYGVIPVLRPFASGYLEGKMLGKDDDPEDGVLEMLKIDTSKTSMEDLLRDTPSLESKIAVTTYESFGITEETAKDMAAGASAYYREKGGHFTAALTEILCVRVAYVACFMLAFLLILIALTVVGNITNLSFKIPNLDIVNDVAGALIGLFTGFVFCTITVWAFKYAGMLIGGDTISKTSIAKSFMEADRLTKYLGY